MRSILNEISFRLAIAFEDYSEEQCDKIVSEVLKLLANKDNLTRLLDEITSSPILNDTLSKGSYIHPNGFAKILLIKSENPDYLVRLHIWGLDNTVYGSKSNIHNHTRDFWSKVVIGELAILEFSEDENGKEYFKFSVSDRGLGYRYLFTMLEKKKIIISKKYIINKSNEYYKTNFETLHQVSVDKFSASIFIQGKIKQNSTKVYLTSENVEDRMSITSTSDIEEIRSLVRQLIAYM